MSVPRRLGVPTTLPPSVLDPIIGALSPTWLVMPLPDPALMPTLVAGEVDAVLRERPVTPEEQEPFRALLGGPAESSALSPAPTPQVLVAEQSPVASLHAAELVGIFSEEQPPVCLTDWGQVPWTPPGPIRPVIAADARGFWRADSWRGVLAPGVHVEPDPRAIPELVAADPLAIGLRLGRAGGSPAAPGTRTVPIYGRSLAWDTAVIARPGGEGVIAELRAVLAPAPAAHADAAPAADTAPTPDSPPLQSPEMTPAAATEDR